MPSSSDQFPDPWNLNRPDDDEENTTEASKAVPEEDDDFGLAELESLLADTARERDPEPELSFDQLDTMFGLGASPAPEDSGEDFDAMLESLRLKSEETSTQPSTTNLEEPDLDFSFLSADGTDVASPPEPSDLPDPDLPDLQFNINEASEAILPSDTPIQDLDIAASGPVNFEVGSDAAQKTPNRPSDTEDLSSSIEMPAASQEPENPQFPESLDLTSPPVSEFIDERRPDVDINLASPAPPELGADLAADFVPASAEILPPPAVGEGISDLSVSEDIPAAIEFEPLDQAATDLPEISSLPLDETDIGSASANIPPAGAGIGAMFGANSTDRSDIASTSDAADILNTPDVEEVDLSSPEGLAASAENLPLSNIPSSSVPQSESSLTGDDSPETQIGLSGSTGSESTPVSSGRPPSTRPSSPTPNVTSETPVAARSASASSPTPVSGSGSQARSVSAGATAGPSTYKQILSGRQQISAFAIVLAGMGGLTTYGLSKANMPNPLKAGLDQAGISLLGDANNADSPLSEATPPGSTSGQGSDPTAAIAQNQDSESDAVPNIALTPTSPGTADIATPSGISAIPNVGGAATTDDNLGVNTNPSVGADDASAPEAEVDPTLQTPPPIDISDVPPEHWAHSYVVAMYEQGVIPDFPDGKFQPDKPVTRAELAASIQRAFTNPTGKAPIPFDDIAESYWAKDAITHAVNSGFMSGYSEDVFQPDQEIPRYQVLVSLVSGLGLEKIQDPQAARQVLESFPDVEPMPDWALGQVAASQQANLIVNQPDAGNTLEPTRPATRAEVSAMIYQALVNAGKIEDTAN